MLELVPNLFVGARDAGNEKWNEDAVLAIGAKEAVNEKWNEAGDSLKGNYHLDGLWRACRTSEQLNTGTTNEQAQPRKDKKEKLTTK